jgi:hypothetical protein
MRFIKLISLFALSVSLMVSCVKSKNINFVDQSSPSPNIVDFPNQKESAALDIVTTPTIYTFYVEASSQDNNLPSTTVTIQKDVQLVTSTKIDPNDTSASAPKFEFLPDSAYQLVSTTSTVDPVTHQAPFQLKVNTTKIDLAHTFAVGYTIASTSSGIPIATNKKSDLIAVGAKNKYDGVYTLYINTIGWGAYGIADNQPGTYNSDIEIITAGINSVTQNAVKRGDFLQPALTSTGGATAFGATTPLYTFDNSTNIMTSVVNTTPNDGRNRQLAINPTPPAATPTWNTFVPATHNLYLAYLMTQTGRPTQYIYETLTYKGPR